MIVFASLTDNRNALIVASLWGPVVCIYLLDIYVFYTVMSAIWGFLLGAHDHHGEIRSLESVHSLFEQFPSAFVATLHVPLPDRASDNSPSQAVVSFITMQFQLCSVFFTFSLGTRTRYFGRTILHGGARYHATGRGFVVQHIKFSENYRLYSRSHFVKGLEVVLLLVVYLAYGYNTGGAIGYTLLLISSWFMALSWLFAPYLFNPSGYERQKTVEDFRDWTNWLFYRGGIGVKGAESWGAWWEEELVCGVSWVAAAWKPLMKRLGLWRSVCSIGRLYDAGMGMLIFIPITVFSWFPFVSTFQTRLMFNQAFSRGLEISLILAGNNPNTGI